MQPHKTIILSVAVAWLLSGCAISRVYTAPQDVMGGSSHHFTTVGFFWNIVPASPVNAAGVCGSGVQGVSMRRGALSVVVNTLTFGIIIPTRVTVTCLPTRVGSIPAPAPGSE